MLLIKYIRKEKIEDPQEIKIEQPVTEKEKKEENRRSTRN